MIKETNKFEMVITHSSKFHADDVFSTALMLILNPNAKVNRTLEPEIVEEVYKSRNESYIIYDIGRGEFDHHQNDTPVRPNGVKYAAFGLLWREFGDWNQYPYFDEDFVQLIDDHDNGGKSSEISKMISTFNPTSIDIKEGKELGISSSVLYDTAFFTAVDFAKKYLIRLFAMYDEENAADELIRSDDVEFYNGSILVLPKYCNYKKSVAKYYPMVTAVIYPSEREGWNVQVVTKTLDTMESDFTFDPSMCGLPKDELPNGVTFVHKSGFLLVADSKEIAIYAAKHYMDSKEHYKLAVERFNEGDAIFKNIDKLIVGYLSQLSEYEGIYFEEDHDLGINVIRAIIDGKYEVSLDMIIDKIIIRSISDNILIIANINSKEIEFYTSKYYNYDN